MDRFLARLKAFRKATPRVVEAINALATAIEHLALRLAILLFLLFALYRMFSVH